MLSTKIRFKILGRKFSMNAHLGCHIGTPPREVTQGRKEYLHYVQPPVPANVDICTGQKRIRYTPRLKTVSKSSVTFSNMKYLYTVISDLSQVSLEYDYHGLPGEG